jgi:3-hydroxyacyl-[acyl-carrier-protein] dehydratase
MLRNSWIVEPNLWGNSRVIANLDAIRQYNPQRYEMEQLTAVVYEEASRRVCVGYRDLSTGEFWVRGHVFQRPVMPPMLMCETAAQLANYYAMKHGLYKALGGFIGLRRVHYRGVARPGERLFVIIKLLKIRGTLLTCQFQCAIHKRIICDGLLSGAVLSWSIDQDKHAEDLIVR